jgi:hypothetical protein
VQFGIGLLLGQESNEGRVLGLLYGLSRLAIVFNNVLYMYKVLKDIYILGVFPESLGDSCTPNAPTVDPPLASRGCQSPATRADPEGGLSGLRRPCSQTTELNTRMTKQVATNATPIDTVVCWCATS